MRSKFSQRKVPLRRDQGLDDPIVAVTGCLELSNVLRAHCAGPVLFLCGGEGGEGFKMCVPFVSNRAVFAPEMTNVMKDFGIVK